MPGNASGSIHKDPLVSLTILSNYTLNTKRGETLDSNIVRGKKSGTYSKTQINPYFLTGSLHDEVLALYREIL